MIHTHSTNRLINLKNRACVYCGRVFGRSLTRTKDHVIGKHFVPTGTLAGQWNLVAGACSKCNADKSDLEDDISVITMIPDFHAPDSHLDHRVNTEVRRKAHRSKSRRTGKPVVESEENVQLTGRFGAATMTLNFVARPQLDDSRICELARFHVQAFFYLLTFDEAKSAGLFLNGDFHLWAAAPRSDWGALKLEWFAGLMSAWNPCLRADGADGFFRIHLRRHDTLPLLGWALEWNKGMRVVGFVGSTAAIERVISTCPVSEPSIVHDQGTDRLVARQHIAAVSEQDNLFCWSGF